MEYQAQHIQCFNEIALRVVSETGIKRVLIHFSNLEIITSKHE